MAFLKICLRSMKCMPEISISAQLPLSLERESPASCDTRQSDTYVGTCVGTCLDPSLRLSLSLEMRLPRWYLHCNHSTRQLSWPYPNFVYNTDGQVVPPKYIS